MERVGIRELRQHASRYIDRVKSGESFEVTERGVPVAMLSPATPTSLLDRLIAEGAVVPGIGGVSTWLEEHPPQKHASQQSLSEILDELREERL
ncbi:MAG: type II toxin-antitoxin system prevent-host-death family antitoxin [Cryobacterium sp.]|nr:type II toxin-antitoxin system prevent-host-death family antitoxin [Cryobacterium sp.]